MRGLTTQEQRRLDALLRLFPENVARWQVHYERFARAGLLRSHGMTHREIAASMDASESMARYFVSNFQRLQSDKSPVEEYLNCNSCDEIMTASEKIVRRATTRHVEKAKWKAKEIKSSAAKLACAVLATFVLTACQTAPVDKACGVIRDDLKTVQGKTPADQQRIDIHHARGRAAGCW